MTPLSNWPLAHPFFYRSIMVKQTYGVVACGLILCILVLGTGCGSDAVVSESAVRTIVADIQSGNDIAGPDISGVVTLDSDRLDSIETYIDGSLSMLPYGREPGTAFFSLTDILGDYVLSESQFRLFGYASAGDSVQTIVRIDPTEALQRGTYSFANNDYASLFESFPSDNKTRVIITDGVQSEPVEGARINRVSQAVYDRVAAGGTFAVMVFRQPYVGQYYSDLTTEDPMYSCSDRPLVAFVMAPSALAVEELRQMVSKEVNLDHFVRVSGSDLKLTPVSVREAAQRGLETTTQRGLRNPAVSQIVGVAPLVHTADLRTTSQGGASVAPIHIEVSLMLNEAPWNTIPLDEIESFVGTLEIEPYLWVRRKVDRDSFSVVHVPIRVGQPTVSPLVQQGDTMSVVVELSLERPAELTRIDREMYLYLAARPTETLSRNLVPEAFSTNDDRSATSCSQVLKLERLIGSIMLNNYVPGQALIRLNWN